MKPGKVILRALRNVIGRQTVAGGSAGVALSADQTWLQVAAALVLVANVGADLVLELKAQRERAELCPVPVASDARP